MQKGILKQAALWTMAIVLGACASTREPVAMSGGGVIHERNQGYSMLYHLMSDDGDVGKIFILKSADEPVKVLVKEIGSACQAAEKEMDGFAKTDKQLHYDMDDLPFIERHGRDLQGKEDEKRLLFSSGKEFELWLIFTQAQAMDYGKQLSRALSEKEENPARKAFLDKLAAQCDGFHDRLMKMLEVH